MAEENRPISEYFAREDRTFSWFPAAWAEDEAAAIKVLLEVEATVDEGLGVEEDAEKPAEKAEAKLSAEKIFGRAGKKPNGEEWFWVCKPTHPSAKPYW